MSRTLRLAALAVAVMSLAACTPHDPTLADFTPVAIPAPDGNLATEPVAVGTCPWATPVALEPAASDDPVETTEANALPEDLFWPVIESIPDLPVHSDFDRVAAQLAGCAKSDILAFDARLTLALYALDGPRNSQWIIENDPSGTHATSDDSFLYSRCAAVLGGRSSWQRAVDEGTLDWGEDPPDTTGVSEYLLSVGLAAAEAQGRSPEQYFDDLVRAVPVSYETGSNAQLWGG